MGQPAALTGRAGAPCAVWPGPESDHVDPLVCERTPSGPPPLLGPHSLSERAVPSAVRAATESDHAPVRCPAAVNVPLALLGPRPRRRLGRLWKRCLSPVRLPAGTGVDATRSASCFGHFQKVPKSLLSWVWVRFVITSLISPFLSILQLYCLFGGWVEERSTCWLVRRLKKNTRSPL